MQITLVTLLQCDKSIIYQSLKAWSGDPYPSVTYREQNSRVNTSLQATNNRRPKAKRHSGTLFLGEK